MTNAIQDVGCDPRDRPMKASRAARRGRSQIVNKVRDLHTEGSCTKSEEIEVTPEMIKAGVERALLLRAGPERWRRVYLGGICCDGGSALLSFTQIASTCLLASMIFLDRS